jgi:4-hydroxybenzoate polyprenyltransferase
MNTKSNVAVEMLESIKFSHTVFALPFALLSVLLARRGGLPTLAEALFVILCMVGARTWAMSVNRLADAKIDFANPRTADRALPAGRLSRTAMTAFATGGAALFVFGAAMLSQLALFCALPLLAVLASYSWAKRFTFLCHFYLGFCLGLAPLGAWIALKGTFPWAMLTLTFGICFWVAGFDILYALQDQGFDQKAGLHSVPAQFGTSKALVIARASHVLAAFLFFTFGLLYELGPVFYSGLAVAVVLMAWQHFLTRGGDLSRIGMAFFNLNGWIAVLLFFSAGLSLLL